LSAAGFALPEQFIIKNRTIRADFVALECALFSICWRFEKTVEKDWRSLAALDWPPIRRGFHRLGHPQSGCARRSKVGGKNDA